MGFGHGELTGGEWEAHLTLNNDDYLVATSASKQEAYDSLLNKAEEAGVKHLLLEFQAAFPSDILLQDGNPPDWFENPPEPQIYCCRYRWDRETDEEIATMRISG